MASVIEGLRNVAVAETSVCHIDGTVGKLFYRGYSIEDLAEYGTFEEVAYLLWRASLPTNAQLESLRQEFLRERTVDKRVLDMLRALPRTTMPMDALRTLVSFLSAFDLEVADNSEDANLRKAIRLAAKAPTLIAGFYRHAHGEDPIPPLPDGSLAENFLYMLTGEPPDSFVARTMDICLILHAEHGFNASTFAARVTTSTRSDMYASVVSAIGTLKGPDHGGANEIVIEMLQEIGSADHVPTYIERVLSKRHTVPGMRPGYVPGFGHRVYKAWDPRAKVLRGMSAMLGERAKNTRWIEISDGVVRAMEEAGMFEKGVYPNVDFFSASTYFTMGFDTSLNTPIFALARIAGWTAHIIEQFGDNRLIRPTAVYVGPLDLKYVPLDER
jgi:citrate synthase